MSVVGRCVRPETRCGLLKSSASNSSDTVLRSKGAVPQTPDWDEVIDSASNILATESKDLWVVAWMIEALTRRHGFAGLRDGIRLARELAETHWETLEPRPDEEDGIDRTVRMLANLNGSVLVDPINEIPISAADGELNALTSGTYREMAQPDRERMAAATPVEFFQSLVEDLGAAQQEFRKLCEVLEDKCGKDEAGYSLAPPSSEIREVLEECHSRVISLYGKRLPTEATADEPGDTDRANLPAAIEASSLPIGSQHVRTREEAFRLLERVAEFFRRTEPHSPISDKLEQAVRWGRMPWRELMAELVPDETLRQEMFRRVGIDPNDDSRD